MIPYHHKRKHGSNVAKKKMARTRPKNLKLNVEDYIASTTTGHGRKPIPRIGSRYFAAYTGLLVDTILLSNGLWDQTYPYRHVAVQK
jgi:hypothetical protein